MIDVAGIAGQGFGFLAGGETAVGWPFTAGILMENGASKSGADPVFEGLGQAEGTEASGGSAGKGGDGPEPGGKFKEFAQGAIP